MKEMVASYMKNQAVRSSKPRFFLWLMRIVPGLIFFIGLYGLSIDFQFLASNGSIDNKSMILLGLATISTIYSGYILFNILKSKYYPALVIQTMIYFMLLGSINLIRSLVFSFSDAPIIFTLLVVVNISVVIYSGMLAYMYDFVVMKNQND